MKNFINLLFYYILILIGLIAVSWIFYARFIRERIIRNIPDLFFTELRFWILLYICLIYLYVIKNLIKNKNKSNIIITEMLKLIYQPLITFDHFFKYNRYVSFFYKSCMVKLLTFLENAKNNTLFLIINLMQILPRIILVTFLLMDTFYFHKLEIFYRIILLGLLPLIFRYLKYSIKDLIEHWINDLEKKYETVKLYEEEFKFWKKNNNAEKEPTAPFHNEFVSIQEFFKISYENYFENLEKKSNYIYGASPQCKDDVIKQYLKDNYKSNITVLSLKDYFLLTHEDYEHLEELLKKTTPRIISLKMLLYRFDVLDARKFLRWLRIIIFSLYFICWLYILIISYYAVPVELFMGKYYIINFMRYLMLEENLFSPLYWGSLNENMRLVDLPKVTEPQQYINN